MTNTLIKNLRKVFGDDLEDCREQSGQLLITVCSTKLKSVCQSLRDHDAFMFEQLIDLCGVDYAAYQQTDWETEQATGTGFSRAVEQEQTVKKHRSPYRFCVVYQLLSILHNHRLRVVCPVDDDPPKLPSVVDIWACANWYEREAFDLLGILFVGHPDLRRLLTDYGFVGHPLRKDFPLQGHVEVRFDPDKKRVIYQPVTIDNRVLVPRVIREDDRYISSAEEQDA